MQPEITSGRQIRGMKMTKFLPALSEVLNPGETAILVGSTDTWMPAADTFVLTTQRLLIMMGKTLAKAHSWQEISGFTAVPEKRGLKVFRHADDPYNINRLKPEDHAALQAALEVFPTMGPGSAAWNAWAQRRTSLVTPNQSAPPVATSYPLSPGSAAPVSASPAMPFTPAPQPPASAPVPNVESEPEQPISSAPGAKFPGTSAPSQTTSDRAELLAQLGNLHAHGVLTDDEYAAATARVLDPER